MLLAGRRKKASGRKKAPSRSSAKSRSSGARLKKRPGRVKKRKAQKIKVARDGVSLGGFSGLCVVRGQWEAWKEHLCNYLKTHR